MPPDRPPRYPLRNDNEQEERRLGRLQELYDPRTVSRLEAVGVSAGWVCAELGAGRGSIASWLSSRVGADGSVTAVDRDTSQLAWLADRANVKVLEADVTTLALPPGTFNLVHTRALLMHLDDPDAVIELVVRALRPGGWVVFEESDGSPLAGDDNLPPSYRRTLVRIAGRWSRGRSFADQLRSLGMNEVSDLVSDGSVVGGTPRAEFWKHTLASVRQLRAGDVEFAQDADEVSRLLDDPTFSAHLLEHHLVTAQKPRQGGSGGHDTGTSLSKRGDRPVALPSDDTMTPGMA